MANLFDQIAYKPDVLSCLADLSNDEVMTPPTIANQMLDLLPDEIWSDPNIKILDPACKSGVILREAAKRFIEGEKDVYPDLRERIDHIFKEQLYGIAITEMTSLLSRRTVYCSKYPNGPYSIAKFDKPEGNIRFKKIEHTWSTGNCVFCGASRKEYERAPYLETHAYELIHTLHPEDIFSMKFDVICSNPPYQLSDGGNNASAVPLYDKFISQAKKLNPHYLVMIIPNRWYSGGRGLDVFRNEMLNDRRISRLYDYESAEDCFAGMDISGGICYFLWDKYYQGDCYVVNMEEGTNSGVFRNLSKYPIMIRANKAVPIIDKVLSSKPEMLSNYVSPQRPFGLRTFARPTGKGSLTLRWNKGKGLIEEQDVPAGTEMINKWKVIVSRVFYEHAGQADKNGQRRVLSILEILKPQEVCTETYVVIKSFDTEEEANNLYQYLKTKFARFLIMQATSSIMIGKTAFSLLPNQDFNERWTDEKLFQKYSLTVDEIKYINSQIKDYDSVED